MANNFLAGVLITSGSLLLSTVTMAEPVVNMTKDQWLSKLESMAPTLVCDGFSKSEGLQKQLVNAHIDYAKCLTLIPASFSKCQAQSYASIPATIDKASSAVWGKTIGECIGTDFVVTNLAAIPSTPAADAKAVANPEKSE